MSGITPEGTFSICARYGLGFGVARNLARQWNSGPDQARVTALDLGREPIAVIVPSRSAAT